MHDQTASATGAYVRYGGVHDPLRFGARTVASDARYRTPRSYSRPQTSHASVPSPSIFAPAMLSSTAASRPSATMSAIKAYAANREDEIETIPAARSASRNSATRSTAA